MDDPFRVIPLDRRIVAEFAYLRLGAAIVCTAGAIWLFAIGAGTFLRGVGLAAFAIAAAWVYSFVKARRALASADDQFLALEPERLRMVGAKNSVEVPWSDVEQVELDEDLLLIRLRTSSGDVVIQPEYGGLSIFELAEAVNRAFSAAT